MGVVGRPQPIVPSFQAGLPQEQLLLFERELGGWLQALKWLIKEFRLHIGYETPDEEAGMRFWMDRFERLRGPNESTEIQTQMWMWPTADEPCTPATPLEVQQARRWPRDAVERRLNQLYHLKRKTCPQTPILIPMQLAKQQEAVLRKRSSASPASLKRRQPSTSGKVAPQGKAREPLFPSTGTIGDTVVLKDEVFASRVIDLAIEFDADPERATRFGPEFVATGVYTNHAATLDRKSSRWREGVHRLEDLGLVSFWLQLADKAAVGLQKPSIRAKRALEDRLSGSHFAEKVMQVYRSRFHFECLDVGVLYRFWLALPKAVRSAHHIRGFPDQQAFELLLAYVQSKEDACMKDGTSERSSSSTRRRPWRPAGDAAKVSSSATPLPLPQVDLPTSGKPAKGLGLEQLAKPKVKSGALAFLKVLARKFRQDLVLQRMLKQCLEGSSGPGGLESIGLDLEAYDLLNGTDLLKKVNRSQPPKAIAGSLGEPKLTDALSLQKQGSLQVWLAGDSERAGRTLSSLKKAQDVTKKINAFLRRKASRYLTRGARLTCLGLVLPQRKRSEDELPGILLVEDMFAQLCRTFGTAEVLARFGSHYLGDRRAFAVGDSLMGGARIDCATRHASCTASSAANGSDPNRAVDGEPSTGWRPEPTSTDMIIGGAWLLADLGRVHGCEGVSLEWSLPRRKEVQYATRFQLRSELHLEGGKGSPIVVTYVRPGGLACSAGVIRGDVLQLGAGGTSDESFSELAPMDALATLQAPSLVQLPAKLVFEGPDLSQKPSVAALEAALRKIQVKVFTAKTSKEPTSTSLEKVCEEEISAAPGKVSSLQGIFVGRWVKIEFASPWPQLDGQALMLSIKVFKVWRLAPPLFRQRFMEALCRHRSKRSGGSQAILDRGFWATGDGSSFNLKINTDIEKKRRHDHDFEGPAEDALLKICVREKKEFSVLRSGETKALKERIFAKDEDVRECTFHPRTAGNVASHVKLARDRVSERLDKDTNISDFVKELGENYDSTQYTNYRMVHRRMALNRARREFAQGALGAALSKLQSHFGVEQILNRFRCFHKGCGKLLDQNAETCACSGFYCTTHKPHAVHDCKSMKKILTARAQKAKDLEKEMRDRGEVPPPEEKFDNKVEFGLILEVYALAEAILLAKRTKEQQRHSLERLGQTVTSFGAVRILERPFKKHMCPVTLDSRRAWTQEGGSRTPRLGSKSSLNVHDKCSCPKAHDPAELRFPAGESVQRRMAWIKEAIAEAKHRSDVLPGSAAEKGKLKKESRAKTPQPKSSTGSLAKAGRRRARSETRAVDVMRKSFEDKAADAERAMTLVYEAQAKLQGGDLPTARNQLAEAKELAIGGLTEAKTATFARNGSGFSFFLDETPSRARAAHRSGVGGFSMDEPESESITRLQGHPKFFNSLSTDAIGGKFQPQQQDVAVQSLPVGRPLRECEIKDLNDRRDILAREAMEALERCELLEAKVRRSEKLQQLQQEQKEHEKAIADRRSGHIPWTPTEAYTEHDDAVLRRLLQTASHELPPATFQGGVRDEMCAEYLEVGRCPRGPDCPYAHYPSQLSSRPPAWYHHFPEVAMPRTLQDQLEIPRQVTEQHQAACAIANERITAAGDDAVMKSFLNEPSYERPLAATQVQLPVAAIRVETAKRTQMCMEFLDTGECSLGTNCPFAHYPSQLSH